MNLSNLKPDINKKPNIRFSRLLAKNINGKPYYEIEYKDVQTQKTHIGYSSFDINTISNYLSEYFVQKDDKSLATNSEPAVLSSHIY